MIAVVLAVALDVIRAWTGAHEAQLLIANREWYGGICEQRDVELEVDGVWFESQPRKCK